MGTPDPAVVAAYGRAFARLGTTVQATFTRTTGQAPAVTTVSATVSVVARNYIADTTASAREGYSVSNVGSISQGDRFFIVQSGDLAAKDFPLPLQKNDTIILIDTGEQMNIISADPFKRNAGGAIEVRASGVQ